MNKIDLKKEALKNDKPQVILVGNGRIGKPLFSKLQSADYQCTSLRIDPDSGIDFSCIDRNKPAFLVISISAAGQSWTWDKVLCGLLKQIKKGEVQLKQIVLISSSRVYEGYSKGIVTAECAAIPTSTKTNQIQQAENALLESNIDSWIIRCGGLYGVDYPKYTPIMLAAEDKPRFGVQTEQVIKTIMGFIEGAIDGGTKNGIQLLTNGHCYFEGSQYEIDSDKVTELSKTHRILKSSAHILK